VTCRPFKFALEEGTSVGSSRLLKELARRPRRLGRSSATAYYGNKETWESFINAVKETPAGGVLPSTGAPRTEQEGLASRDPRSALNDTTPDGRGL